MSAAQRPTWLHPDAMPVEATNMMRVAYCELHSIICRLAECVTLIAAPAIVAYQETAGAMDAPDAVKDAVDELSGYQRLYDAIDHTGEFLQSFVEHLDHEERAAKFRDWADALPYVELGCSNHDRIGDDE